MAKCNWRMIDCITLRLSHVPVQPKNHSNITRPFPMWGLGAGNETRKTGSGLGTRLHCIATCIHECSTWMYIESMHYLYAFILLFSLWGWLLLLRASLTGVDDISNHGTTTTFNPERYRYTLYTFGNTSTTTINYRPLCSRHGISLKQGLLRQYLICPITCGHWKTVSLITGCGLAQIVKILKQAVTSIHDLNLHSVKLCITSLPYGVFVDTLCQIVDNHFILPWSKVNGHRPLDLCPVLVDDHGLYGTVSHASLNHLSHRDTGKCLRLQNTSIWHVSRACSIIGRAMEYLYYWRFRYDGCVHRCVRTGTR